MAIGGKVNIVAEPGARIILGGGELEVTDEASLFAERELRPFGSTSDPSNTDDRRVKVSGSGTFRFSEFSRVDIPRDAIVGIESIGVDDGEIADGIGRVTTALQTLSPSVTNLVWMFQDDARLQIGSEAQFGGALQVGNPVSKNVPTDPVLDPASIDFDLRFEGRNAKMEVASQGFFGMGAGIVDKPNAAPNTWSIGSLQNVNEIATDIREGKVIHNRIFSGNEERASLLAVSENAQGASFIMDNQLSRVIGGGNMKKIAATDSNVAPTVGTTNDEDTGIMSSKGILFDPSKIIASRNGGITITRAQGRTVLGNDPQNVGGTPPADTMSNLFRYLKMNNVSEQSGPLATIHERRLGQQVIGYVENDVINRVVNVRFVDLNSTSPSVDPAFEHGIVGLALGPAGSPTAYNVVTA